MRRQQWFGCAISAVLSFCICFAGVMCLQSAFGLEGRIAHVAWGCAISAVLFSVGFTLKWWYISLVPVLSAAGLLWYRGRLAESVRWLLYQVSRIYDMGYHCGVLCDENIPQTGDGTLALCLIGCFVAFVCAWVICRRKPAILAVLTGLLPLAACFAVVDTVPKLGYLYLLLVSISILLISQLTRNQDCRQGNRLTLLATVPVALGIAILFWALPRDTYRGQERVDRILETVQNWLEDQDGQGPLGTSTAVRERLELDKLGRLTQTRTPVLTVSVDNHQLDTQKTSTLYLRQQGFQIYDGTSWHNEWGNDIYAWVQWDQMEQIGEASITTRNQHLMQFVPYYAQQRIVSPEGQVGREDVAIDFMGITENLQGEYVYIFYLYELKPEAGSTPIEQNEGYHLELPVGTYTPDAISLPPDTVSWAEPVVAPLIAGKYTVKDRAEAIGAYVRTLARYDRNTARMPAGETDFAKWFATQAGSGYCVHYATTAAVLLRAAGIQAQYVEGYVARVPQDGTAVTVYEDQAHAWVEYYDPAVGWRILECTPPEGVPTYIQVEQNQPVTEPQGPQQGPQQTEPGKLPQQETPAETATGWYWVLGILSAAAAVVLQWRLRLWILRSRLIKGDPNRRAVQLWRELTKCERWLKKRPAPALYALAQKARFSQHTLTAEEVRQLTKALEADRRALKAKPWYYQIIYTIVLAIY